MRLFEHEIKIIRQCFIDDKFLMYDVCSDTDKDTAVKFYGDRFEYIGTSKIYYINNVRHEREKDIHFFIKKPQ